jgi:hypothetical protein
MIPIEDVIAASTERLMSLPNVVGVGLGDRNGREVVAVFVTHKVPLSQLAPGQVVPRELHGHPTDVIAIGVPHALEHTDALEASIQQQPGTRRAAGT